MPDRSGNGGRGDWLFGGMRLMERADAAFFHFKTVMHRLADFYDATAGGDRVKHQQAVAAALRAHQDLHRVLVLNELFQAGSTHLLGPWPTNGASDDTINLHAMRELHLVLDWLSEIAPLDSIKAARANLKRLENRQRSTMFRRDRYEDRRKTDEIERNDRAFLILLTYFVAARDQVTPRELLSRLDVGVSYDAFEKWVTAAAGAKEAPKEQRRLMAAAGRLDRVGAGLSREQADRLSRRSKHVLLRNDPDLFPGLATLTDHEKLQKLFAQARRAPP